MTTTAHHRYMTFLHARGLLPAKARQPERAQRQQYQRFVQQRGLARTSTRKAN